MSVASQETSPAAPPAPAMVEVRGIGKTYDGGVEALKGVDLAFAEGKLTTLLGPSGCGKTTLLKIIAGLLAPSAGEVLVKGRKVSAPGSDRAFVFQDFALMPWATVLRNVAFGLELRGTPRAERDEIARKCTAQVGLAGFEDSYPGSSRVHISSVSRKTDPIRCIAECAIRSRGAPL